MLSAIHGLTLTWSGGQNMDIANQNATWFGVFGRGTALGIPIPVLIFVALAAVLGILLGKTALRAQGLRGRRQRHGRDLPRAFRARGSSFMTYIISAFCVATAGLIQASPHMGRAEHRGAGHGTGGAGRRHPRRRVACWAGRGRSSRR